MKDLKSRRKLRVVKKTERNLAVREVMLPRDTNAMGSIFGGHILSLVDMAAGEHARFMHPQKFVTKVVREVEFIEPVYVGDTVSFYTRTKKLGNTSITIQVDVEARRGSASNALVKVTSAEVVMVAIDDGGKPTPIKEAA